MSYSATPREFQLLEFIRAEINRVGYAPSFNEMLAHMGLRSKSGIHRMLESLERRGRISRIKRGHRAIQLDPKTIHGHCPHCGGRITVSR